MIPRIPHPSTPLQFPLLIPNPLSPILTIITALQPTSPGFYHIAHTLQRARDDAGLNVIWLCGTEVERSCHAEESVEGAVGVCVDGEGGVGALVVAWDCAGVPAADYGEVCWGTEGGEGGGCEVGC